MGLFASTSLDANLLQLINLIAGALVTSPGGSTPVTAVDVSESVSAQEVDCTALTLAISAPAVGAPALVQIGFPGAQFNVSGYIKASTLNALMNQIPVYTTSSLPAANTVPPGSIVFNSTTMQVIVSNGSIWSGTLPVYTTGTLPLATSVPVGYAVFNSTTNRVLTSNGLYWVGGLNTVQNTNSGQIGPANAVSFDSPNISKEGSGLLFVDGSISGYISPQQTVTINLYRDGTGGTLLASNVTTPGGAGGLIGFFCDLTWLDALPDLSAHHYTIQAIGSSGADVTIPIDGADFQVFEL